MLSFDNKVELGDTTLDTLSLIELLQQNSKIIRCNVHGEEHHVNQFNKQIKNMMEFFFNIIKTIEDENMLIEIMKIDGLLLKHVSLQTENICLEAVKSKGMSLKYVINQTYDICMEAVKENGRAYEYALYRDDTIAIEAVKTTYDALKYIDKQNDDICIISLQHSIGSSFDYIQDKNENILLHTINIAPIYIVKYKNAPIQLKEIAIKKDPSLIIYAVEQTYDMCKNAVMYNGYYIKYVLSEHRTREICEIAVRKDANAIMHIEFPDEYLCMIAIDNDPFVIKHIKNQTHNICEYAVRKNPKVIQCVEDQTEYLTCLAVDIDPSVIVFINKQYNHINKLVVSRNGLLLKHINNQTREICDIAIKQNIDAFVFVKDKSMYTPNELHNLYFVFCEMNIS
jgi:hypothetical protein